MITYTVIEYEEKDFEAVKEGMTAERAICILESMPRGYFPYTMPSWGKPTSVDLDHYEICCAIEMAIARLKEREQE